MTPTIFALATPPGRSAIAVIRISGPATRAALTAVAPPLPPPRQAALRRLRDPRDGGLIDEALVLFFAAPRSETGEDQAELQLHGGRAIVAKMLEVLGSLPEFRPAEPGEFARRAFANGKLDLTQLEGLADLIDAETEAQRRAAARSATGATAKHYMGWRAELLDALALVESAIDFSDEGDLPARIIAEADGIVRALASRLEEYLADANRGEILRSGFRVVLAGPPNAGKSSLLNALARRDVAIVSPEPGTTRDILEARLDLAGLPVIVTDTAGLRETSSAIEQEGIRRSTSAMIEAGLVLWLEPADDPAPLPPPALASAEIVRLRTKADLGPQSIHVKQSARNELPAPDWIHVKHLSISARTGMGLDDVLSVLASRAAQATGNPDDPAITRPRHRQELAAALQHLRDYSAAQSAPEEIRAEHLRRAAHHLGRLTGAIDSDEVLGAIFSRFCIGK